MATFKKRVAKDGSVSWWAAVRMAGSDPVYATRPTRKEAESWARGEEDRIRAERKRASGHATLGDAIARYLVVALPLKEESTRRSDIGRLRWWVEHYGGTSLSVLTPPMLAEARDRLVAEGRSGPTANRYLAALSAVLRKAAREWEWISENPLSRVDRFPESKGRTRYMEGDEIERLLDACGQDHALKTMITLAVATGMRQGELMRPRLRDVYLRERLIALLVSKNGERRGVPLSFKAAARLRWWLRYHHPDPRNPDAPLFPAAHATTKNPWWSYKKRWEKVRKASGLGGLWFHDTRHTTASHIMLGGGSLKDVQAMLGHKTTAMAARYSHLSAAHLRGIAERVSARTVTRKRRSG